MHFKAQWVPEPPVDPATLDKTFGLKDATCRPNLMRMQSKDKPPSSIGELLSYLKSNVKFISREEEADGGEWSRPAFKRSQHLHTEEVGLLVGSDPIWREDQSEM